MMPFRPQNETTARHTTTRLSSSWTLEDNLLSPEALLARRGIKRRKTEGMNSRFDRMIATVNAIPTSESYPRHRRASSSTSGTCSSVSHDVPKTPVDAYKDLEGGRLGKDFSIIKMHQRDNYLEPSSIVEDSQSCCNSPDTTYEDVPTWLSDVISTVDASHPIRNLVPARPARQPFTEQLLSTSKHPSRPCDLLSASAVEEDIFAFRAPTPSENKSNCIPSAPMVDEYDIENRDDDSLPLPSTPLQEHSGSRVAQTTRLSGEFFGYLQTPLQKRNLAPPLSFAVPRHNPKDTSLCVVSNIDLQTLDSTTPTAPFSTPGPFVGNSARRSLTHVASPHYMPALYALTATKQLSPGILGPTDATPPFSTPGPLARQIPPIEHNDGLASDPTICQPLAPKLELPGLAPPEVVPDIMVSSSPDLFLDTVLHTPAPSSPRRINPKLLSFATSVPKRIYFDSPAEDPIGSDPLDASDYVLEPDYDHLGFRWERFDPSKAVSWASENAARQKTDRPVYDDTTDGLNPSPSTQREGAINGDYLGHSPNLHEHNSSPKLECEPLPVRSLSTRGGDREISAQRAACFPLPAFERPSFAPALGIYISPLRENDKEDDKENVQLGEPQDNVVEENPPQLDEELTRSPKQYVSPPRTPINQIMSCIPKTPDAPGNATSAPMPASKIAVLSYEDVSEDGIEDSDVNEEETQLLSQDSHDTIESWSVV